jgi:ABC-type multidrug transport system ATPase subunit
MLGNPKVIILDEPTAGLDPKERIRIRNIISEIAFQKIVIIATHVVSDIEYIAKEVLLIKKGQIVAAGSPYHLCDEISGKVYEIKTTKESLGDIGKTYKIGNISRDEDNIYVRIVSNKAPSDLSYQPLKPNLEDLYLHYFDEVVAI